MTRPRVDRGGFGAGKVSIDVRFDRGRVSFAWFGVGRRREESRRGRDVVGCCCDGESVGLDSLDGGHGCSRQPADAADVAVLITLFSSDIFFNVAAFAIGFFSVAHRYNRLQ